MSKVISATVLRTQLSDLLDELKAGETHFFVERNSETAAVLLSFEKFQEIMQTLEMLNSLEYLDAGGEAPPGEPPIEVAEPSSPRPFRGATESVESAAARLGIRIVK